MNGYFEEIHKNKYFTRKEIIKVYEKLWSKIRDLIRSITKSPDDYDEKYMKIKINSDDELPLNKIIEIHNATIVVTTVFHENNKQHPQVSLDECFYKLKRRKQKQLQ